MMENPTEDNVARIVDKLERLETVLDCEYKAILEGNGKSVASLAEEKERIADELNDFQADLTNDTKVSSDIRRLTRRVKELASLNHELLQQMHCHYQGMLELFMRIGGHARTYGKNGMINKVDIPPGRNGDVLA